MMEEGRQLKIKTNVCRRLHKEIGYYRIEAEKQQARIDQLIAKGGDESEVRRQKEVKQETINTIPDVITQLRKAVADLHSFIEDNEEVLQADVSAELEETRKVLADVTEALKSM